MVSFHIKMYGYIDLYTFFPFFFSVFRKTTVWVWLKGSGGEGSHQAGVVESSSPAWWAGRSESSEGCTQMAFGTLGQWRRAQCAGRYHFLCEKEVTGEIFVIYI